MVRAGGDGRAGSLSATELALGVKCPKCLAPRGHDCRQTRPSMRVPNPYSQRQQAIIAGEGKPLKRPHNERFQASETPAMHRAAERRRQIEIEEQRRRWIAGEQKRLEQKRFRSWLMMIEFMSVHGDIFKEG